MSGVKGTRIATGIFQRPGGTYNVAISVGNRLRKRSFEHLRDAISWRDEQIKERAPVDKRRAYNHWSPQDVWIDEDDRRAQIEQAPRKKVKRGGRNYTVIQLPYVAPVKPTDWREPSLHQTETA